MNKTHKHFELLKNLQFSERFSQRFAPVSSWFRVYERLTLEEIVSLSDGLSTRWVKQVNKWIYLFYWFEHQKLRLRTLGTFKNVSGHWINFYDLLINLKIYTLSCTLILLQLYLRKTWFIPNTIHCSSRSQTIALCCTCLSNRLNFIESSCKKVENCKLSWNAKFTPQTIKIDCFEFSFSPYSRVWRYGALQVLVVCPPVSTKCSGNCPSAAKLRGWNVCMWAIYEN